jgi:hypothetical protein
MRGNRAHLKLTSAPAGACRNALTVGDPFCQHGGLLHDNDAREPTSCSFCDCPEAGWGGVACESASHNKQALLASRESLTTSICAAAYSAFPALLAAACRSLQRRRRVRATGGQLGAGAACDGVHNNQPGAHGGGVG